MEMMYTGRRPIISDMLVVYVRAFDTTQTIRNMRCDCTYGLQRRGPTAKPRTVIEQVRVATSSETLYLSMIRPRPPVTMEEPKAAQTTRMDTSSVTNQRKEVDQFFGFSGSPSLKVTNSRGSSAFSSSPGDGGC